MNIAQPTQVLVTAYPEVSQDAALVAPFNKQLAINMIRAFNRSGGTIDVGIVRKFSSASFQLYTFNGTSTYAAVAVPPLGGNNPATVIATVTANNGFVIQSKYKSGLIGFDISQDGASGVYVYQYWNGTAWSSLTTIAVADFTGTGANVVVFLPPLDWKAGGPAGLDSSKYSIRVTASTAPNTAIIIDDLWSGALLEFYAAIADKTGVVLEFDTLHPFILEAGEGIMPYFGTANAANGMTISYSTF